MATWQRWSVLSTYVRFYQWTGFLPYRLDSGKINAFLTLTILNIVGVAINLALIVEGRHCILYHCESIGRAVDFIKLVSIILTEVVIAVELFRTIPHFCAFWNALHRAHEHLHGQGMVDHRRLERLIRTYWLSWIALLTYFVLSEPFNYFVTNSIQTRMFYLYFCGLRALFHLKEQQLMYPAIMLNFYLRMSSDLIERHVQLLRDAEALGNSRYLEFLAGGIGTIKLLHTLLYQASVELNASCGWTYLIIYSKNYVQIVSNSYWVVFWTVNGQWGHASRILSGLLVKLMILSAIFYINNMVMKTSSHISHQLNAIDLKMQIQNRSLFIMIESFIQQVNTERITLTAADCLVLNYKPIITIVFTVLAYISLFIQQAPKNDQSLECYHRTNSC